MTLQMSAADHLKHFVVIIFTDIMKRKRLKLSIGKCKLLKINSGASGGGSLTVCGKTFKYLVDTFNSKSDSIALCKHRVDKSVASTIEIVSLCKETNFK